ncbi:NADH-quinone oxidoreductase subunit NuoE [bacterium]|nr:NADH-quinone oxidoreductase subunit NuoE [candidate division CSSED10-310 bacterium]
MLVTQRDRQRDEIIALADELGHERSAMIPILQGIQKKYGFISEYAMQVLADTLGIHPVEVNSVVSFYSFLYTEPKGRFVIRLCKTISCMMKGTQYVARQLENDLGISFGETTGDSRFSLEWVNCLGMCDQGPAMLVNDKVYTHVTPEAVHEIIEECRSVFGVHAMQGKGGL